MAEKATVKLKIKSPSLDLEFEGNEAFLRSEVPKLVQATTDLQVVRISESLRILHSELEESLVSQADIKKEFDTLKSQIDSMSEVAKLKRLQMQMAMDSLNKAFQTLSNLVKKSSETAKAIIQNLK